MSAYHLTNHAVAVLSRVFSILDRLSYTRLQKCYIDLLSMQK